MQKELQSTQNQLTSVVQKQENCMLNLEKKKVELANMKNEHNKEKQLLEEKLDETKKKY